MTETVPYNSEMIMDFFDHLLWEIRILNEEHKNPESFAKAFADGKQLTPELCDILKRYMQKYDTVGLLPVFCVENDAPSSDEFSAACVLFHQKMQAKTAEWMLAMESLAELLEMSINVCDVKRSESDGNLPYCKIKASSVLNGDFEP